jgi:hypothetical protein
LAPPYGLDKKWGHWWITEDNALRSEYLAWPAAYFAFKQPEEYYFYFFRFINIDKRFLTI